jgi:hypothetical protein
MNKDKKNNNLIQQKNKTNILQNKKEENNQENINFNESLEKFKKEIQEDLKNIHLGKHKL